MMTDKAGPPVVDGTMVWLGLDVKPDGIPFAIKAINQWVTWRAEPKANGQGMSKVPYQCNGTKASSTDPRTWTDYSTAIAAVLEDELPLFSGPGLVIRKDNGLAILDFDHVRNALTGVINPDVLQAVLYLETYAEISPSGTGIRVIGFGTLEHAVSGKTLQGWSDGRYVTITGHRIESAPDDVRTIDPERLAQICSHYAPATPPNIAASASGPMIDQAQVLEIRQALGFIDPDESYDTWITCGMALSATGAPNAFGLWNEWSLQGAKYNAREMRPKWASFRDDKIQLPSLFKLAQDRGWINPASRAAMEFENATGMSFKEANRSAPEAVLIDPEPAQELKAFPVDGLDDVARWMDGFASVAYPVVTQQAVLCLISTAAARRYITPYGDPLSLYLGVCGRSIAELRYAHAAITKAISDAGFRRMLRAQRLTTPQAIYRTLMRSPACVYLSDDYGGMSAFSRRQPSGAQEHAMAILTQIYDGMPIHLDSPEDAGLKAGSVGDDQPVIQSPSLSLFALVGSDHLATLLRASELGRGALGQLLMAITSDDEAVIHDPTSGAAPPWLTTRIQSIRGITTHGPQLDLASINDGNAENIPHQRTVFFDPGVFVPAYERLDALTADRQARPLLLEARKHARRVAANLAVWRDPDSPTVDSTLMVWSADYVADRVKSVLDQFSLLHGDNGKPTAYDQVAKILAEAGRCGIAKRDLHSACWAFRNLASKARGELLEQMLGDESIFEISSVNQKTSRKNKVLVSAKFIKKAD